MSKRKNLFHKKKGGYDFSGVEFIYSTVQHFNWSNAVFRLRRSSDNQAAYVFFDNSAETITLNSKIDLTSATVPSTTDLGTWIGTDNGFVIGWESQRASGSYDVNSRVVNNTASTQPQLINAGSIITRNSLPALYFDGSGKTLSDTTPTSVMNDGQSFTLCFICNNDISDSNVYLFSNRTGASFNGLKVFPSRKLLPIAHHIGNLQTTNGIDNFVDASYELDTADVRMVSVSVDSTANEFKGYVNGSKEDTVTYSNSWANSTFTLGSDRIAGSYLNGTIQEIILFPSDKDSEMNLIQADRINKFDI